MTSTNACNSSRVYTLPVGLDGEHNSTIRVRLVMAASNCAGVTLKSVSMPAGTVTTVARDIFTISM